MNLSIIIPLLNEQESLPELHQWIVKVMTTHNYTYEVIFIDDGSTDNSWQIIADLSKNNPNVKGIRFLRNFGKSQALHAGFAKANGDVVIPMEKPCLQTRLKNAALLRCDCSWRTPSAKKIWDIAKMPEMRPTPLLAPK